MITLKEHNALHRIPEHEVFNNRPRSNGIECPRCKAELFDTSSSTMMTYPQMIPYPPQKSIGCISCGYEGYRRA